MPGVRVVDRPMPPKFLATNQFKLRWSHFTPSESQPSINGKLVHAKVGMSCEFEFADKDDVLIYQDQRKRWRLGHVTVKCLMNKARSIVWAVPLRTNTPSQNAELLKHERVHVELAERHARYIYQYVRRLWINGTNLETVAQGLINAADRKRVNHWNKLETMNAQYDLETAHGTKQAAQQQWNEIYLSVENTNSTL